jgi:signal transduction histidine kinase
VSDQDDDADPIFPAVPVLADADRIGQVLTNYLTNALKYAPADRPVTVQLEVVEGRAVVAVHDEGPGLPWEERSLGDSTVPTPPATAEHANE